MKNPIVIFLLFISFLTKAQVNQFGYPFYTNYGSEQIGSTYQNWDIANANNGIVYIANNHDGIIEYDGSNSRFIKVLENEEVRCLAINKYGQIFVGCSHSFGLIEIDENGLQTYKSLSSRLADSLSNFSMIYKVNCINDDVYFSSDNSFNKTFKYNLVNDSIIIIKNPPLTLFTFKSNNKIYGGSYSEGLFAIENNEIFNVKGGDFYKKRNIFSVNELSEGNLQIVTGKSGIFKFDIESYESQQTLDNEALTILNDYISYDSKKAFNKTFVATIGNGINVINEFGQFEAILTDNVGIKDQICSSLEDVENLMFGTLTNGAIAVEYLNPIRKFDEESGFVSWIGDIVSLNNTIFVGTDDGVYLNDYGNDKEGFVKISNENLQVFSLAIYEHSNNDELLVVGTINGLFIYNAKESKLVSLEKKIKNIRKLYPKEVSDKELENAVLSTYKLYFSTISKKLWVSTARRFFPILENNDEWFIGEPIVEIGSRARDVIEVNDGTMWISTDLGDLFHFNSSTNKLEKKVEIMRAMNNEKIHLRKIDGVIAMVTKNGIFSLINDTLQRIEINGIGEILNVHQSIDETIYINHQKNGEKRLSYYKKVKDIYSPIKLFTHRITDIHSMVFHEFKNRLWFTNGSTLYNFPLDAEFKMDSNYHCLVRKVEGYDSVYFNGTYYKDSEVGRIPSITQHEKQKPVLEYEYNDLTFHYAAPFFEGVEHIEYSYHLKGFKESWSKWNKEPKAVFTNINEGKYTFQVKAKNVYDIESSIGEYSFTILPPWYRTILAYVLYVILGLVALYIFVKLYTRRLQKEKEWLEGVVRERTAEIREQRDEIQEQKQSIEDSIHYASRIQKAILPADELAECILPEHFILFRPRDVVSGDYYWMNKIGDRVVLVAADCTGHGVPGAFMSMLGVSFLNEIVLKENVVEPHIILNKLRSRVKKTLKQEGKEGEAKDGMDVALVVFDQTQNKLYFAGAYNSVLIYRGEELIELKADRMPIGIYIKEKESFTLHEFDYQPGDTFYIFSDGYPDQFGGPKGSKFRIKAMKQLIMDLQPKSMEEQKEILNTTIEEWMAETPGQEQIDDMVVIGVRL